MTRPIAQQISIPVGDGSVMTGYLAQPAARPTRTAVVVLHELFAVNPGLRSVVDDLAAAGHLAVAPELYHRHAPPGHWYLRDDAGRTKGFEQLDLLTREQVLLDVTATIEVLQSEFGVEHVVLVGFSAGGHAAYLAACRLPVSATVVLYGGWLAGTQIGLSRPEPTIALTPGITGRLTYLVGDEDTLIGPEERNALGTALKDAGVEHELVTYPGVGHAFFWPDSPAYDQPARAQAWQKILEAVAAAGVPSVGEGAERAERA